MSQAGIVIKEKKKEKLAAPAHYVVLLHNDPFTPRGFVVQTLRHCFTKPEPDAAAIMREAHDNGFAVVGTFSREIAEMKAQKANSYAAEHGHILLFSVEKR